MKKKQKLNEFQELLAELTDDDFLDIIKQEGINPFKFAARLRSINESQTYTVIGYGSLMKLTDAKRTLANIKSFKLGYINGYKRIFNTGRIQSGAYLNVKIDEEASNMPVAVITISGYDMLMFIYRERMYQMDIVDYRLDESEAGVQNGSAYIVRVASKRQLKVDIEPMLSYFSLCIAGAKELMDARGFRYYLNKTMLADESTSISQWMQNFSIANYYKTHTHTTR